MKQNLIALARDVDAFCARMNRGLAVAAVVLAVTVAALAATRAEQLLPQTGDSATSGIQASMEP